jgi:hypothetical protein
MVDNTKTASAHGGGRSAFVMFWASKLDVKSGGFARPGLRQRAREPTAPTFRVQILYRYIFADHSEPIHTRMNARGLERLLGELDLR